MVRVIPQFGKPLTRYLTLYRAPVGFELRTFHLPVPLTLPNLFGIDPVIDELVEAELIDQADLDLIAG